MTDQITEAAFDVRIFVDAERLPLVIDNLERTLAGLADDGSVIDYAYPAGVDYTDGLYESMESLSGEVANAFVDRVERVLDGAH